MRVCAGAWSCFRHTNMETKGKKTSSSSDTDSDSCLSSLDEKPASKRGGSAAATASGGARYRHPRRWLRLHNLGERGPYRQRSDSLAYVFAGLLFEEQRGKCASLFLEQL